MAINPLLHAAIKALSLPDVEVMRIYKVERLINRLHLPVGRDYGERLAMFEVPVWMFRPEARVSNDVLLFFHGGGWVTGNNESYARVCRALADFTGRRVLSVDYGLAPEKKFPRGLMDCYEAARTLYMHAAELQTDPGKLTLVGDSAGGNLAAAVSLMARDRGEFSVARQILIYPALYNAYDETSPYPSVAENGKDYILTSKRVSEYVSLYLNTPEDYRNPYFAPLLAEDLSNQPRTLILTAEFCPLRDEGEAYGEALRNRGNSVSVCRVADALHGSIALPLTFQASHAFYLKIKEFLCEEDHAE